MPTDLPGDRRGNDLHQPDSKDTVSDADQTSATTQVALRRRAMDYLARREHSRRELERKLDKAFPDTSPDMRAAVLDQLESDNLLSNYRYCESFYHSRVQRGYGPRMIRYELQQRGVEQGLIEQVFAESETDWFAQIARLAERRGLSLSDNQRQSLSARDWQRHQRYFTSRGFTPEHISSLRSQLDIHR